LKGVRKVETQKQLEKMIGNADKRRWTQINLKCDGRIDWKHRLVRKRIGNKAGRYTGWKAHHFLI
jgi:hypothetical protein